MANNPRLAEVRVPITKENAKEMGAKGGKAKKGKKHLSTHIQDMLNDPNFELKLKDKSILKGRPIEAVIKTAIAKAVSGDMKAFNMLAKYGYGEKLTLEFENDLFGEMKLKIEVVNNDSTDAKRKTRTRQESTERPSGS